MITKSRFLHYQGVFYQKLRKTPHTVQLEVFTVATPSNEFSMDDFVGDAAVTPRTFIVQALYERDIPTRTREKYGLPSEVNGIVYISPLQLVPLVGTFRLDWNKTKVHFQDHVQVIQKIEYLEPLFDSCVGIQLFLKDALKA